MKLTIKQTRALDKLEDEYTRELAFGGGAGGGKSLLGCYWILKSCFKYPESRYMIGRTVLKRLRETTFFTMTNLLKTQGLSDGIHFSHQSTEFITRFSNGSSIVWKDLARVPSDPDYDYLGSLEITGAFIDEAVQVDAKCKEVVKSRIRYKLDDYLVDGTPTKILKVAEWDKNGKPILWFDKNGIKQKSLRPKSLYTCNPSRGWIYNEFYLPDKMDEIEESKSFIQSLAIENPHLPPSYIESLGNLEESVKQRLLFGNWEFEESEGQLFTYVETMALFNIEVKRGGTKYISCDIAMQGSDKFVLIVWDDWTVIELVTVDKSTGKEVVEIIQKYADKYKVPSARIIYDSDGVGNYVGSYLYGSKPFHNNGKTFKIKGDPQNYKNIKSQCFFKLSEIVKSGKLSLALVEKKHHKELSEELTAMRNHSLGTDRPLEVTPKKDLKSVLGRSPDYADALMMRAYYEVKPTTVKPRIDW